MKLVLAAVFGAGYVVGTRAGRERYEQIVSFTRRAAEGLDTVRPQERLETYAGRLESFASRNGRFVTTEPTPTTRAEG
jgi:hypothetical protein